VESFTPPPDKDWIFSIDLCLSVTLIVFPLLNLRLGKFL